MRASCPASPFLAARCAGVWTIGRVRLNLFSHNPVHKASLSCVLCCRVLRKTHGADRIVPALAVAARRTCREERVHPGGV